MKLKSSLQNVLDAICLRSAFGLDLKGRMDRLVLIEAAYAKITAETDPALVKELLARRSEAILALATFPSPDNGSFSEKCALFGNEIRFPDTSPKAFNLLSLAFWAALVSDARAVGAAILLDGKPLPPPKPRN